MGKTNISWTDTTWNPLAGCTRASPGCDHCYAASMALRLEAMAEADIAAGKDPGAKRKYIGVSVRTPSGRAAFNGQINFDDSALDDPFKWKKPRMVFVNSMSDLFHKDVPDGFIDRVFSVMAETPQHTYQVLTKRPERMAEYTNNYWPNLHIHKNIWLGVSVEDQDNVDRIDQLVRVPARVRFVSAEPLLSFLDIQRQLFNGWHKNSPKISWLIVGGESGHHARPMQIEWARSLRDQCQRAGTAYFLKQLGGHPEPRHNLEDFPEDLRIREFPV